MQQKHRILAQLPQGFALRATVAGIAALGSVSVIGALNAASGAHPPLRQDIIETLRIKPQVTQDDIEHPFIREEFVKAGDSLRSLLSRLGIDDPDATDAMLADPTARNAAGQLRAGRPATASVSAAGKLLHLTLPTGSSGEQVRITRTGDAFSVTQENVPAPSGVDMRGGVITSSLFAATDGADVPDAIANQLVDLFGTDIDFHTDLRRGDQFKVVFEAGFQNGKRVSVGRVLAAEFVNQNKTYRVFLFRDPSGRDEYYSDTGQSLRQGFLRSPLEFSRITSGFSLRQHPILKTWRQHKGVDFGAPMGTAVKATGDGTVDFVGSQNGYGNLIVLKHRDGYSTAYAHLSRFTKGLTVHTPVSQGQVIGYVGQTGWATGPHLHYEFRVAGTPRDPLTVALPMANSLSRADLPRFKQGIAPLQTRLALLSSHIPPARGD